MAAGHLTIKYGFQVCCIYTGEEEGSQIDGLLSRVQIMQHPQHALQGPIQLVMPCVLFNLVMRM